jgi:hypothetical protein
VLNRSLQAFQHSDLNQLSVPATADFLQTGALTTLDVVGRVAHGIDDVISGTSNALSTAIPAGAQLATSLLPMPDSLDRSIVGAVEFITSGGMWLAKITATASVQGLLFGLPAWSQAARTGVAVWSTTADLQRGESSSEFFTRCLNVTAQETDIPQIKRAIASPHEAPSPETIKLVADHTATSLINRVRNFYNHRLGRAAGQVEGLWSKAGDATAEAQELHKATEAVSKRLAEIFSGDLPAYQTAVRINKTAATLNAAFGTYHSALKGLLGIAIGAAWHTGALHSYATVAWGYITGGIGYALKVGLQAARRGVSSVVSWGKERVQSSVAELKGEIESSIKEQVSSTLELKNVKELLSQQLLGATDDKPQATPQPTQVAEPEPTAQAKPVAPSKPRTPPTRTVHPLLAPQQVFVGLEGSSLVNSR